MRRNAYLDYRMNSAIVSYGQLRQIFVLLAGQGYDAYGCEIPDAYVEPLAPVYDALIAHVDGMRAAAGGGFVGLAPSSGAGKGRYDITTSPSVFSPVTYEFDGPSRYSGLQFELSSPDPPPPAPPQETTKEPLEGGW